MGDASIEISETLSLLTVTVPTVGESQAVRLRRLVVGIACLVLVAIAASVVTWKLKRPSAPPSKPVRHFVIHPEMVLGFEALWHHALALSPDGRRLAYVGEDRAGRRRLYLRELDEPKARPLPGTESAILNRLFLSIVVLLESERCINVVLLPPMASSIESNTITVK